MQRELPATTVGNENMNTVDQATLMEWLDSDVDGQLDSVEQEQLQAYLSSQPELEDCRQEYLALHRMIEESRIEVSPEFSAQVMESLPAAAWQQSTAGSWRLPLAMMLLLTLGATVSLSGIAGGPVMATGQVVLDFFQTTLLAGSGVIVAAWRGAGMGLEELFAASDMNLLAMAFMVLCINLLFFSLLRRRQVAKAVSGGAAAGATASGSPVQGKRPES